MYGIEGVQEDVQKQFTFSFEVDIIGYLQKRQCTIKRDQG